MWFALHVSFTHVAVVAEDPLRLQVPDVRTFDWRAALIAAVALVMIFLLKLAILPTLAIAVVAGLSLVALG